MDWVLCIFFIIYLYALYKERQALGCPDIPNGKDCDNANGKAVKGTMPVVADTNSTILNKMEEAANFSNRWVMWRIGFVISLPCIVLIYFILDGKFPTSKELVVGTFVISAIVYFTFNFYKFHLINYVQNNIDEGIEILRTRI